MKNNQGFTLVELIATIVFLGFVIIGISTLYVGIDNIQRRSQYVEIANRAAQTEIETLRNSNYNQLVAGQTIDFTNQIPSGLPSPNGSVAISQQPDGLKRVDVTVSFNPGTAVQKVELSSLIGVIGITQ